MGIEDVFILGFSWSFKDILVKNRLKFGKNRSISRSSDDFYFRRFKNGVIGIKKWYHLL